MRRGREWKRVSANTVSFYEGQLPLFCPVTKGNFCVCQASNPPTTFTAEWQPARSSKLVAMELR